MIRITRFRLRRIFCGTTMSSILFVLDLVRNLLRIATNSISCMCFMMTSQRISHVDVASQVVDIDIGIDIDNDNDIVTSKLESPSMH